jgi:hypothetical protein
MGKNMKNLFMKLFDDLKKYKVYLIVYIVIMFIIGLLIGIFSEPDIDEFKYAEQQRNTGNIKNLYFEEYKSYDRE